MSTNDARQEAAIPETFGVAFILDCDGCGRLEFAADERERFERMQDVHGTFCAGGVSTYRPSATGPNA